MLMVSFLTGSGSRPSMHRISCLSHLTITDIVVLTGGGHRVAGPTNSKSCVWSGYIDLLAEMRGQVYKLHV